MDSGWMGAWGRPMGARLSHVIIFVIRPFRPDKNTWQPRSLGRGVWEGRWLAGYSWLDYGDGLCWLEGWQVSWLMGWLCWLMAGLGMAMLADGWLLGWLCWLMACWASRPFRRAASPVPPPMSLVLEQSERSESGAQIRPMSPMSERSVSAPRKDARARALLLAIDWDRVDLGEMR